MQEIWKPVPGYEGRYLVSNHGRVRSLGRWVRNGLSSRRWVAPMVLSPHLRSNGYLDIGLRIDNNSKFHFVHRLIAEVFIPNPGNLPEVNHLDGNKTNNCAENLQWVTSAQNKRHAVDTGLLLVRGADSPSAKLTADDVRVIRKRVTNGETQTAVAIDYGIARANVYRIVNMETWGHVR